MLTLIRTSKVRLFVVENVELKQSRAVLQRALAKRPRL